MKYCWLVRYTDFCDIIFYDSVWLKKEDAEKRVEELKAAFAKHGNKNQEFVYPLMKIPFECIDKSEVEL